MTPRPLQAGHAPSELALNSAALTAFALAKASRMPVEDPGVGGGVGASGPLDWGLVDHHQVGRAW